jgi:hypothetical protein
MKKSSCVFLLSFLATSFSPTFSSPSDYLFNEPLIYTIPSLAASVMCADILLKAFRTENNIAANCMCCLWSVTLIASPLTQYVWRWGGGKKGLFTSICGSAFSVHCLWLASGGIYAALLKDCKENDVDKIHMGIGESLLIYGTGISYTAWKIYNLARYVLNK